MRTDNMAKSTTILWFRRDLRVTDNPALHAALAQSDQVIPVFIYDDAAQTAPSGAGRWWLHHSLAALKETLARLGLPLMLRRGDEKTVLTALTEEYGATACYWNRRYEPTAIETDKTLKAEMLSRDIRVESFNGNLIREPWEVKTGAGNHYRVFTPFWRALQKIGPARTQAPAPNSQPLEQCSDRDSDDIENWNLLPKQPNWAVGFAKEWNPGEDAALAKLDAFLDGGADRYADGRDRPDIEATSRLSPHLAFGEISPLTIWERTHAAIAAGTVDETNAFKFLSQIAWRDFSYNLLFHHPQLPNTPLKPEFEDYPWQDNEERINAWQSGQTGYPIVDAGMRQLWKTGWMHNRVRMVVASFLIKDIGAHWRNGLAWFEDTLVDADLANNCASWQWVAGSGADAAPFFRIFNPVTQGEKFDPEGTYVREFVPELGDMPKKYIHAPWTAPDEILAEAGVTLGENYPKPMLDHKAARDFALAAYKTIRNK